MESLLPLPFWHFVTRLGEAQILLPAAAVALTCLILRPEGRRFALAWTVAVAGAVFITTATKVAFIGWGVGWPELDFTGISGHAMFSASVLPLLMATFAAQASAARRRQGWAFALALAALIAWSRVIVGAHSPSESLSGWWLGAAASTLAAALTGLPARRARPLLPVGVALWLALGPACAAPSRSHDLVTALSLKLSGRAAPYLRRDFHDARRALGAATSTRATPLSAATTRW